MTSLELLCEVPVGRQSLSIDKDDFFGCYHNSASDVCSGMRGIMRTQLRTKDRLRSHIIGVNFYKAARLEPPPQFLRGSSAYKPPPPLFVTEVTFFTKIKDMGTSRVDVQLYETVVASDFSYNMLYVEMLSSWLRHIVLRTRLAT